MTDYVLAFKPTALGTHDFSACLLANGRIIAAVEEERFCRVKHAKNVFPRQAIRYCLQAAGIEFDDLAMIGIPYDPNLYIRYIPEFWRSILEAQGFLNKYNHLGTAITKLTFRRWGKEQIWLMLRRTVESRRRPPLTFVSHHLSHAASAYFCSGFDEASVITIDGIGEYDSTVLWQARSGKLQRVHTFSSSNSLGHFYSLFTEFLGFQALDGEGKLMALAAYGEPDPLLEAFFASYTQIHTRGYDVSQLLKRFRRAEHLVAALETPQRRPEAPLTQKHANIAWHVQNFTEKAVSALVIENYRQTGVRNVCLAGGVAMNCMANKKIMELKCVDDLFIQPVAGDAGLALGCAQIISHQLGHNPSERLNHVYWGPGYSDDTIETILRKNKIDYKVVDNLYNTVAASLVEGKFVGWFQGRMEFGPRALGHRSILASPSSIRLSERLNNEVKHREPWRPFAPSVLAHRAAEWFISCKDARFMIKAFDTVTDRWEHIAGVVHPIDKTARVQVVDLDTNERYYRLIEAFEQITGIPMLLNTSFNLAGEPIVCSPEDALSCFFRSGLDILVLGKCIVSKSGTTSHVDSLN